MYLRRADKDGENESLAVSSVLLFRNGMKGAFTSHPLRSSALPCQPGCQTARRTHTEKKDKIDKQHSQKKNLHSVEGW